MDVLEKLTALKKQNHWTNYRVAKESGLSSATISNIFSRHTQPRIDTLEAICNAFGLTLAQFFVSDERFVSLNDSQLEMFKRWEMLPKKKKEAFNLLLELMVEDQDSSDS